MRTASAYILMLLTFMGCSDQDDLLFRSRKHTGIQFQNYIEESPVWNILSYELVYNGGGVGVGDFDQDGLQDLYFTGNMIPNKLYLNRGKLKFKEITAEAGVAAAKKWSTGVTVVDINQDGWPDLYVCASTLSAPEKKANMLFLNNGLNDAGVPTFTESAAKLGINDMGNSTHSTFFDYDNDGDLDLYVLTDELGVFSPNKYRPKDNSGRSPTTDRLYRNELNTSGRFINVSQEAGIIYEGYGLGVSVVDINDDGWKDLYVSNDYLTNDLLYINQQDGTFRNEVDRYFKHQTHSAMGNDVADINNDGLPDIITMDMLPGKNDRLKKMQLKANYANYLNNKQFNYEAQFIRNTLQLNQGMASDGRPRFSEIGFLAGVHATDWSWAPLLADFDNDGHRDLVVSNGFPKDITDMDFSDFRNTKTLAFDKEEIMAQIPEAKVSNYIFRSRGDLTFEDKTTEWGLETPSYSNGTVFVDLDNDGDLDLVFNNINEPALVYENRLYNGAAQKDQPHYLQVQLTYKKPNAQGLGTHITLYYGEHHKQYQEYTTTRGYISSVDPVMHFGLGEIVRIDSIHITWPDGSLQLLKNIAANQRLKIDYAPTTRNGSFKAPPAHQTLTFREITTETNLDFTYTEKIFIDFNAQRLIPHQFSQRGPFLSKGDVDGNGQEDFFIGGSLYESGTFFLQNNGTFRQQVLPTKGEKKQEDTGNLLFDADGDGDLDLYLGSGSTEHPAADPDAYQDRLYINDGRGNFREEPNALPRMDNSTSAVKAADFDRDGDLDLFVASLLVPQQYPLPATSFLLRNESTANQISFVNVATAQMREIGLVNDAIWSDFNNDEWPDLILVGEWMPLVFFENRKGQLSKVEPMILDENRHSIDHTGWWNCISAADFDADGDPDYLIGNQGTNTVYRGSATEPLTMLAGDFDNNGQVEGLIGTYYPDHSGQRKLFPIHAKEEFTTQLAHTRKRFLKYADYAAATLPELLTVEEMQQAVKYEATFMESAYLENLGNGKFCLTPLPLPAQFAPIYDLLTDDFDGDGLVDGLLIGNDYGNNPYWGLQDAFNGLFLKGNGKGNFLPQNYTETGFLVPGDGKSLTQIRGPAGNTWVIVGQNQDQLKVFEVQ